MQTVRLVLSALLCAALAGQALGEVQPGPPVCPAPANTPHHTTRAASATPTAEELRELAAREAADPSVLAEPEPANFGVARYRLEDYYDCTGHSGCYWAEVDAQTRRAEAELDRLLAVHHAATPDEAQRQKLALVLDIDETSLTSYCEEKREDFGYIPSMFEAWIVSPEASIPIPGTLRLFNHARAAGVSVFFITGRAGKGKPNDQTAATARNLNAAGYHGWQGLMLHDATYPPGTAMFKSDARAKLFEEHYRILLNVGDQWSDLRDQPDPDLPARLPADAERSVKLPNPFYYLP